MWFNWFRKLVGKSSAGQKRRPRSVCLRLSLLDDRIVPSFLPPINYAVTNAGVMVTGDFNADGRLDLATANGGTAPSISVLSGNGDGTFQAAQNSALAAVPGSLYTGAQSGIMAAGDFNGDGKLDLAVVTNSNGEVLLGNGDGTFQAPLGVNFGMSPTRMTAGDLNGDGFADIAVANPTTNSVNVLVSHGDGTFAPQVLYYAGSQAQDVKTADMNHDGHVDLVAADAISAGDVSILLGNGDGTFQPCQSYYAFSAPYRMTVGDFNNDGNPDVCVANSYTSSMVSVLMGNGDGTLQPYHSYDVGSQPWDLQNGDFNGDGHDDLVELLPGALMQVEAGRGDGTFMAPISTPATTNYVSGLAVGDFNGDGVTDVAQSNSTGGSVAILISGSSTPAAATQFTVNGPTTTFAGAAASVTVTAYDPYGNLATDYAGTVTFISSDAQAGLPAGYTFTAADHGSHTFNVTLKTAGSQTVTAYDTANAAIRDTSNSIAVTPAAASSFTPSGGGGFIGSPHTVTVTARDVFGNLANSYNGTVHLTSSDAGMVLPPDGSLVNGVGSFQVTPMTLGAQTLSATDVNDGTITGKESITVTPGWAAKFVMTSLSATTAGSVQPMTVTAYDAFGNVSTAYTGTVVVSSSDAQAGSFLYTFTAADAGVHTFNIALRTAGTQSVTVSDWANAAVFTTQSGIIVTPAAAASLSVTPLRATMAGVAQTFTVTAKDAFGNVATGYLGAVGFASSDKIATLPAAYTFTAADAGVHTFSVTLKSSGNQSLTIQDTVNAGLTFFQKDVIVSAGAMTGFAFRAPSNVTVGVAFSMTVSAVDAYGNVITGYTGKVHFTGPTGIPADYTFTAADAGVHTFSVTLSSTGTQTIGIQDVLNGSLKGQVSVTVKTSSTTGGGGGGGGGTGGGGTGGGGGGGGGGGA